MRRGHDRDWACLAAAIAITGSPSWAENGEGAEDSRFQTVVTASRAEQRAEDTVVATEVVTQREIERSGARDLAELLEAHPGAEVIHSFRGAGLRLLGLDPEYTLVLIDGERVAGRTGGTMDLSRFSLRGVERVEIVKGPASVLYGSDAMAGVVNLVTRGPRQPFEALGRLSYGTRRSLDASSEAGLRRGAVALSLSGGMRGADAYDLDRSDPATSGSARGDWDIAATGSLEPSDRIRLQAQAAYARTDLAAVDATATGAQFDRRNRSESFAASARASWQAVESTALTFRGHHSLFRDQLLMDQRRSRELDQYQDAREWLYELGGQLDQELGRRHRLSAGVEALTEAVRSDRLVEGTGFRRRLGALVQHQARWKEGPRLDTSAGFRIDLDSRFGSHPSPRLAVRFDPLDRLTLRLSYGWGFRAPSFTEMFLHFENPAVGYLVEGEPSLRPERSAAAQLTCDLRFSGGTSLSLGAFRAEMQDLIGVVSEDGPPDAPARFGYANVSRARSQGLEAGLRLRPLPGVWLDLGYAFTDARELDQGSLLEGRAMHRGTASISARHPRSGWEGNLRASVVGPRPFRRGGDPLWAAPYADLDLRVARQMNRHLTLFALATNLLNAGHAELLPMSPRGIQAGVSARY